jgi:hypothetical protein
MLGASIIPSAIFELDLMFHLYHKILFIYLFFESTHSISKEVNLATFGDKKNT